MTLHRPIWLALALVTLSLGCKTTIVEGGEGGDDESGGSSDGTGSESGSEAADGNADDNCSIGSEGCPCTEGGACDPGLTCDGGVCVDLCEIGLEGCPCTQGGACNPGLVCDSGICEPAPGDGDTGDDFMCGLDDWCDQPNPDACMCEGCSNNGDCAQDEDCICPDCTNEGYCGGDDDCQNDGVCQPYFEGCTCIDCAGHPAC